MVNVTQSNPTGMPVHAFRPVDLQKLWEIKVKDWSQLQVRGLIHAKESRGHGRKTMPSLFDVYQAAQIGLQTILVREVRMPIAAANHLAKEARAEIENMFASATATSSGGSILYAVRPEPAKWMRVTPDMLLTDVDDAMGSSIWMAVDVSHIVHTVCKALADRNPEAYNTWLRKFLADRN